MNLIMVDRHSLKRGSSNYTVPPKKLEGGQRRNEVVLKDSPEANNGDTQAQIQPWSSHQKD